MRPFSALAAAVGTLALLAPATADAADQIAYSCDGDLCVVDPDNPAPLNLTDTDVLYELAPEYSPDGTKLAFSGSVPGATLSDVYTLTVSDPALATNVSQTEDWSERWSLEWSPGGNRIAYGAEDFDPGPPNLFTDVFVSPADGTAAPLAIGSSMATEDSVSWSPDGSKIAFSRRESANVGGIFTGNADGSGTPVPVPNTNLGISADWSADGTRIAAVIDNAGSTTPDYVRVVRADGAGTPVDVGSTPGTTLIGPVFSPDDTRVLWMTHQALHMRNADGTGPIITITDPMMLGYVASWSPDGTRIAYTAYDADFHAQVVVANADGTGTPRAITDEGIENLSPVWKPDPDAQPPVDPPVDPPTPPGTQTRPPVTVSLANFRTRTFIDGGYIPISFVSCPSDYPTSNPRCQWRHNGTIKTKVSTPGRPRLVAAKPKKKTLKLPGVPVDLAPGESGELRLRVPKKAQKALRPGKTYKLKVSVEQTTGSDPVVKTTKTLKLKVPKKGK